MQFFSFDTAWQLSKDRRERLLADGPRSRLRRIRPRPPVDNVAFLPPPPSTGGRPSAA
jgi:hypothetical protein